MESTVVEINSLIQDGILLVNDDTFLPESLIHYDSEPDIIHGKILLEIATDFRDKCEFVAIMTQLLKMILCSKYVEETLNIDSNRAASMVLSQFNKKHKLFINWLWDIICGTGLWPMLKFILSVGLSITLSKKS